MGTARAEDPLGKALFFTKLAEAVPMESVVFCRSENTTLVSIRAKESHVMSQNTAYTT